MKYKRLSFEQYFIDQSQGSCGGTPQITFEYKTVRYEGTFLTHDASFKVLYDDKREVYQIYFKETSSFSQWISNFNFPKKYYDSFQYKGNDIQLKAARGWSELYCALKWYIREELSTLIKEHGKHEVEIIGWSLGSAIAQLCAQDLYFNYKIKSHVFTYGSVKPWYRSDKNMKDYLADCTKECYNFYNKEDIVGYMVPFCKYFAMNHVKLNATDKKHACIIQLFNPKKYHTCYYLEDLYLEIK